LEASDRERQLIAYEIHDELAQQLSGAIMQFEAFDHFQASRPTAAAQAFETGMALLRQSLGQARRLISGVRPPILDEEGIVAALDHLVNEERQRPGLTIEYFCQVEFARLAPILENAVYRIVQEGLANARQHSKGDRVWVELVQRGQLLYIEIRDGGVGFKPEALEFEGHFGVAGICERVRLLGGNCSIQSAPGKGTRIAVELPLLPRTADQHAAGCSCL
jgi:signal transduction histidine kinase